MRESHFVEQNKEKWLEIEQKLKEKSLKPQDLRKYMYYVADDLSYSRTFYKNRSVRVYLNSLSKRVYAVIYKNRKNLLSELKVFFSEKIPSILYEARTELLIVFCTLLLAMLIGYGSADAESEYSKKILSVGYVDMSLNNIESGNPMGVYSEMEPLSMFYMIFWNNLKVTLLIFAFGLLFSYGSLFIIFINGIVLGTFMQIFYSRGVVAEFNATVWMHGTVEILTMVVAGVSGMLLGKGLLYPGTLNRSQAFRIWGKKAAMLVSACFPFVFFAAIVESFLTRYTDLPHALRYTFILLTLFFMVFYFVYVPTKKFKGTKNLSRDLDEIRPDENVKEESILKRGYLSILMGSIIKYAQSKNLRIISILSSLAITFIIYGQSGDYINLIQKRNMFFYNPFWSGLTSKPYFLAKSLDYLLVQQYNLWAIAILLITLCLLSYFSFVSYGKVKNSNNPEKSIYLSAALIISSLLTLLFIADIHLAFKLVLMPVVLFVSSTAVFKSSKVSTILAAVPRIFQGFASIYFSLLLLIFFSAIILMLLSSPVINEAFNSIDILFGQIFGQYENIKFYMGIGLIVFFGVMNMIIYTLSIHQIQDMLSDIFEADSVREKISEIGKKKKAYGLETE